MNILAILPTFRSSAYRGKIGGGEISNRLLLEGLAERGSFVSVIAIAGAGQSTVKENGVWVSESPQRGYGRAGKIMTARMNYTGAAFKAANAARPDIILTATDGLPVALAVGTELRVPVGVIVRAFENFKLAKSTGFSLREGSKKALKTCLFGPYGEAAMAKADFLMPNSAFMEKCCHRAVASIPTQVIYPPLRLNRLRTKVKMPPKTVSMIGTSLKKGTRLVEYLARAMPELDFRIVGVPGCTSGQPMRQGNLTKYGWCDVAEEFAKKADIVLVPSVWEEPFGRVAIEALAAGKIVLASAIGGLPEALGYEQQLLIAPGDLEAWRVRLSRVVAEPAPFVAACDRAAQGINRFSAEVQVNALQVMLENEIIRFSKEITCES